LFVLLRLCDFLLPVFDHSLCVFLCPYRHSCPLPPEKRGFDFKNPERCPLGQELKRRGLLKYVKIG